VLAVACAAVALGVEAAAEVEVVLMSGVGWVSGDLARRLLALDRVIIVGLSLSLARSASLFSPAFGRTVKRRGSKRFLL
jgi:hypothetical protein